MAKLMGVPAAVIDNIWPDVEPFVQRCLDKVQEYRWLATDIRDLIRDNSIQLWLCLDGSKVDGIVITELSRAPRATTCEIFLVAGEFPENWKDCLAQLEQWAKDMGCTHMATLARPGSAKIMGYSKTMIRTFRRLDE